MCIIFFAVDAHPIYPLVIAANRDEYVSRPTQPAHRWGSPTMVGGRDVQAGGTWLAAGVNVRRWGAVTNVAGSQAPRAPGAKSRGHLIGEWCAADPSTSPCEFASGVDSAHDMAGFNALVGDIQNDGTCRICHVSNRDDSRVPTTIESGIHGLANGTRIDQGGGVERGKELMREALAKAGASREALIDKLMDTVLTDPAYFLPSSGYCTRSSAVIVVDRSGMGSFVEVDRAQPPPGLLSPARNTIAFCWSLTRTSTELSSDSRHAKRETGPELPLET
jgi:uncharacterized protein with NRDE domain